MNDHVTVHWINELDPSVEALEALKQLYIDQTPDGTAFTVYGPDDFGVWGIIGGDAVLLFKASAEFQARMDVPIEVQAVAPPSRVEVIPLETSQTHEVIGQRHGKAAAPGTVASSSARTHHRVTG